MLIWEEGYKIGHAEMDSEHLILFSILNQLDVNINNDKADDCIADVLGALGSYIRYHFTHEETVMRDAGYPRLEEHAAMHRAFVDEIEGLRAELGGDDQLRAALKLRAFVLDWLLDHIMTVDADYARFVAER